MELDHPLGMLSHQEANDIAGTTIVRSIEVPLVFRQLVESTEKIIESLLRHGSNRLTQVSKCLVHILQIQSLTRVVLDDPWEDRVLSQV